MNHHDACTNMIKQQLRTGNVLDTVVLELFKNIPREHFISDPYKSIAYSDLHIPLAHEQKMMTPLEEGLLLQALHLNGDETILEIGTGTAYFTALLSRLCQKVISIDYFSEFTAMATQHLSTFEFTNIELYTIDGHQGWIDKAPYDVIIITSAQEKLCEKLKSQVRPGGKIFAIIGTHPIMHAQLHTQDQHGHWHMQLLFETQLPSLIEPKLTDVFVF